MSAWFFSVFTVKLLKNKARCCYTFLPCALNRCALAFSSARHREHRCGKRLRSFWVSAEPPWLHPNVFKKRWKLLGDRSLACVNVWVKKNDMQASVMLWLLLFGTE